MGFVLVSVVSVSATNTQQFLTFLTVDIQDLFFVDQASTLVLVLHHPTDQAIHVILADEELFLWEGSEVVVEVESVVDVLELGEHEELLLLLDSQGVIEVLGGLAVLLFPRGSSGGSGWGSVVGHLAGCVQSSGGGSR